MVKQRKLKKGKLIVVDGIDGSGKATQVKLLVSRLKKEGKNVKTIDFPRYYRNMMGKLIGECLAGKHGDFVSLDPYITSVLFAADRFESSKETTSWLERGCFVIADRYTSANQIHQAGKIANAKKREVLLKWLERLEYGLFQIPRPDAIIYLDITVEKSQELSNCKSVSKKKYLKGRSDQYECNQEFLKDSRKSALDIVKKKNEWIKIDCLQDGKLMTKQQIGDIIWNKVQKIIK